ncbi:hypothetical protein BDP27DRAFT_1315912 [Rhodocollybia butyracea]|uniref:F-box domain-containing protein n=1 Tax=Rhodocollybia butyracea TaxID=206335 RepID=A0A9P5Q661_9AGAR|nr:hypothetical protein BDP27DRAFT_1315912 [Rhodocollybia butyracea]
MECSVCGRKIIEPRVNLSPTELAELKTILRLEFGPFVVNPVRAEELKRTLALADKDIEDIESNVVCLRDQQRLEHQRATLRSILSGMRRLPNETLLRIFEYVCDENVLQNYPLYDSDSERSTKLTPPMTIAHLPTMAVSSVCSRWRELALSSPSLWAGLTVKTLITTFNNQATSLLGFISTLDLFLTRSSDWPLRLAVEIRGDTWEIEPIEPISLTHLTRHSHRWKIFKHRGTYLLTDYETLSNLQCPSLTELDINSDGYWVASTDLDCFEHSPRLRALALNRIPQDKSKIPYHQLDHADFVINSSGALEEVLRKCPSLKSFELQLEHYHSEPSLSVIPGTWRDITSIVIREYHEQSCSELVFPSFSFPSLNVLQVERLGSIEQMPSKPTDWPGSAFISFVCRSCCMITTFTIRGISLSDLDLIGALRVMPSLLHLEIDNEVWHMKQQNPITLPLISSLTPRQSSNSVISLVPKLHSLRLLFDGTTFYDRAFVSMIQSRWFKPGSDLHTANSRTGISCIRSVVLRFSRREVNVEVYKPLRVLDEDGLRVVVIGTNGVQI